MQLIFICLLMVGLLAYADETSPPPKKPVEHADVGQDGTEDQEDEDVIQMEEDDTDEEDSNQ